MRIIEKWKKNILNCRIGRIIYKLEEKRKFLEELYEMNYEMAYSEVKPYNKERMERLGLLKKDCYVLETTIDELVDLNKSICIEESLKDFRSFKKEIEMIVKTSWEELYFSGMFSIEKILRG